MSTQDDWDKVPTSGPLSAGGLGAVRVAAIFGAAAVAIALIAVPLAERIGGSRQAGHVGIDRFTTGTTGYRGTYTERRSVLQPTPHSVCVIRDNGRRSGDC